MKKNLAKLFVFLYLGIMLSVLFFSIYGLIESKKTLDDITLRAGILIYRIACDRNVTGITSVKYTSHHRLWSEEHTSTYILYADGVEIGSVSNVYTEDKDGNIHNLQTTCNP